jgi:hypothetical protein
MTDPKGKSRPETLHEMKIQWLFISPTFLLSACELGPLWQSTVVPLSKALEVSA